MPHVEYPGLSENDIKREGEHHPQAYAHKYVNPVQIHDPGQHGHDRDGKQYGGNAQRGRQTEPASGVRSSVPGLVQNIRRAHSFSATLSPRMPVGLMMRMRISTRKERASFQAMVR